MHWKEGLIIMTSKELVKICQQQSTCKECLFDKVCEAYQIQFKCYPFDVKMNYKAPPEASSDTQIQFPDLII